MTILRSPSGSWVNVRDRKKVFIYLRWGWTVFTDEEAWALAAWGLEDLVGESGPEMFIPDQPGSIIPIGALE